MHYNLLPFMSLLACAFLLIMLAQKLKIPYPVFLVLAGLGISYVPGIPGVSIDPELIFLVFLPPLLYEAAWYTSWNEFWKWKRAIGLLSFGLVVCTSTIVAFAAVAFIPGFTLPMGFLLGGIISPPDAIAASSILSTLKIPKRISTILEGESLVNDASSLIIVRFALLAIISGHFSVQQATVSFFVVTFMGIAVGLVIAYVIYLLHKYLPTTASIDAAFTLISPYFMYLAAEHFHVSGVMSVVSGGLFLSYRSHQIFLNGQSRIQATSVWATLIVILNGLVFILMGLQLPVIIKGLGDYSQQDAWGYGLIISLIILVVRFMWLYPATFLPRILFKSIREKEANPTWKSPILMGWASMRGVVSLAAALSLPLMVDKVHGFPHRNLIIFITFVVIMFTLVFQGFTLSLVIKMLGIKEIDPIRPYSEEERDIKLRLMQVALQRIEENYLIEAENNSLLGAFRAQMQNGVSVITERQQSQERDYSYQDELDTYNRALKEIYLLQRNELYSLRQNKAYTDEAIRREEVEIDLAEAKIANNI